MQNNDVYSGLDVLIKEGLSALKNKKVALLANQASISKDFKHIIDIFIDHKINLQKIFAPEHGLAGVLQDMEHVNHEIHAKLKCPIISLYGDHKESLQLKVKELDGIDTLVCDLQDIGSRYYTFHTTIAWAIKACSELSIELLIIDRPNPIGAQTFEGNIIKEENFSFVGAYPLLNRHGFTMGEIVKYVENYYALKNKTKIIKMENYDRSMNFQNTHLPFVPPSPNMPRQKTACLYPGLCLIEGTNVSEARGTTFPFEAIGAPFIDKEKLIDDLTSYGDFGIAFMPFTFRPMFQKHQNNLCEGIFLHIKDLENYKPVRFGIALLHALKKFDGFKWRIEPYEYEKDKLAIDLLLGDKTLRTMIEKQAPISEIFSMLEDDEIAFSKIRNKYLLY